MPQFLIFEDVRETRKCYVEAVDYDGALAEFEKAHEEGDEGSFVAASAIAYEIPRLNDVGEIEESCPAVEVE